MRVALVLLLAVVGVAPVVAAPPAKAITRDDAAFFMRSLRGIAGADDPAGKGALALQLCRQMPTCASAGCSALAKKIEDARARPKAAPLTRAEADAAQCPDLAALVPEALAPERGELLMTWARPRLTALVPSVRPLLTAEDQADLECMPDLSGLSGKPASPKCKKWREAQMHTSAPENPDELPTWLKPAPKP